MESRHKKLLIILNLDSDETYSVTELYNKLFYEFGHNVSRKTIERDLWTLHKKGFVEVIDGTIRKFKIIKNLTFEFSFTKEEVLLISRLLKSIEIRDLSEVERLSGILKKLESTVLP